MDLIKLMLTIIVNVTIWDAIDILVVSYIFYKIYKLIEDTRAVQLLKGILLIIILIPISSFFNLTVLNWILNETITIGVLSIVIIFQPEIRRALEHIGRSTFYDRHILENEEKVEKVINEIVNAVENMSKTKTGALIIIEQTTGLEDIILTGTKMDAMVSASLIENIFFENTPLHDGATVIRNDRILASGCFLPLSTNSSINKKLGTRHRAGIGISENSDALTIIVSEETGVISLAVNGKLTRNYTKEKLKDIVLRIIRTRFFDKKKSLREKVKLWMKLEKKTS